MSPDRFHHDLVDALRREVDGVTVDPGRALAEFPRALSRRRQRRGATLAAALAVATVLVALTTSGVGDRRAEELPVEEPDRVVTVEPTGTYVIKLGASPTRISLRGSTLWAALSTGSIARVDTATGTVSRIGALPSSPFDVEPTDTWVWVSLPFANKIVALDPDDGQVVHTVTTASPGPRGLVLAGGSLWATAGNALLELDPDTGRQLRKVPLPAAGLPYDLAVSTDSVWVTDARTTTVTRYRLDGGRTEETEVGAPSVGVVVAHGTVWVGLKDVNRLVRLDAATGRIRSRPALPAPALGLAVIAGEVWVGVPDADQVRAFDAATGTPSRNWQVGDFPPIVTGDDLAVYVSSNLSNEIIRVPREPNGP